MNQKEIEARIPEWRDRWLAVGLTCDPADFDTAEKAIAEIYEVLGHAVPPMFRCTSPLTAQIAIHIGHTKGVEDISEYVKREYTRLLEEFSDIKYEPTGLWGQFDFPWVSFDTFGRDVAKLECSERDSKLLDLWATVTQSAMAWWPFEEACFISDRPYTINVDERYRLHCEDGPAIAWRDGFEVYALEGIHFAPHVVMDTSQITVKEVTDEQNQERRRILMQRMGLGRFMEQADAKMIHKDDHGELYEFSDNGITIKVVKVWNGTPVYNKVPATIEQMEDWRRDFGQGLITKGELENLEKNGTINPDNISYEEYYLRVRPHIETAKEAVMSTFPDVTEEEFDEMVRT